MAKITLITGGARSGKSSYAQSLAEKLSTDKKSQRIFVATSPLLDKEMQERIKKHKEERSGKSWHTIEEEIDLRGVLTKKIPNSSSVILIDCITLWINNLLYHAKQENKIINETIIYQKSKEIVLQMLSLQHHFIIVTNEVGLGIVPENSAARKYRDLVGTANQCLASFAEEVILVSCGLPLYLKK